MTVRAGTSSLLGPLRLALVCTLSLCSAWYRCDVPSGNGICPDANACCRRSAPGDGSASVCVPAGKYGPGVCCEDGMPDTGCRLGYRCSADPCDASFSAGATAGGSLPSKYVSEDGPDGDCYHYCQRVVTPNQDGPDFLPRYHLCSFDNDPDALRHVYGHPVLTVPNGLGNNRTPTVFRFAYMSTMGPLSMEDGVGEYNAERLRHGRTTNELSALRRRQSQIDTILVMVHGSRRSVEDYLCSADSTTGSQSHSVMVVAPWFLTYDDPVVSWENVTDGTDGSVDIALRWAERGPINHTWRYGADTVNVVNNTQSFDDDVEVGEVSAYEVMDAIIRYIIDNRSTRFPNLQRIVLAGHSAGGQYAQRWALLTNSPIFRGPASSIRGPAESEAEADPGPPWLPGRGPSDSRVSDTLPSIRVVVANPRSLCFLDDRRILPDGTFGVPENATDCPWYDQWEWGLGPGDALATPYKDRAIAEAGGVSEIVRRYPYRDIVYLAGELDVQPLEDLCAEEIQGPYRRARSLHFFHSLRLIYGKQVHHRLVVGGVPHDHSLMFQSTTGQKALFGSFDDTEEEEEEEEEERMATITADREVASE